jgi:hypothetical protein
MEINENGILCMYQQPIIGYSTGSYGVMWFYKPIWNDK